MSGKDKVKQRDPAIELYRVLLMFGICLLHSITQCGHPNPRVSALLSPCVNGFVFISGWFGIRFGFKSMWKLVFSALYAGGMAVLLTWLFMPELLTWDRECLKELRYVIIGQWFFLAYLALMLVAPAINFVIERIDREHATAILIPLTLLLVWNWMSELPVTIHLIYPSGFGSYTPLALVNTYVVARLVRKFDLLKFLTWRLAALTIVILTILFSALPQLKLSAYASPMAILYSGVFFSMFEKHVKFQIALGRVINMLSPSMFTVYLLHSHEFGFVAMSRIVNALFAHNHNIWFCYLTAALFVFCVGVLADAPRRFIFSRLFPIISHHRQRIPSIRSE